MGFDDFWNQYPPLRRRGKLACQQKWAAITSEAGLWTRIKDKTTGEYFPAHLKATPEWLMRCLAYYKANKEPEFYHEPATWLNAVWPDYDERQVAAWEVEDLKRKAAVVYIEQRRVKVQ